MKITKEHIGEKVTCQYWLEDKGCYPWVEVLAVDGTEFWGKNQDGLRSEQWTDCNRVRNCDWQLYHEPFIVEGKEVKVGDKLAHKDWANGVFCTIIDKTDFGFIGVNGDGDVFACVSPKVWRFYQEKKLYAPAIIWLPDHSPYPSGNWFTSEEEAKKILGDRFLKWPAIPNKDGFYEV